MKKVLLITSFPPNIGGGAVNVKSVISYFKEIDINWIYLHNEGLNLEGYPYIGQPLMGGSLIKDLKNSLLLWSGFKTKEFEDILAKIISFKADVYWIVGHNEGILIARELARTTNTPIHISLHDDIPYGVFGRSLRYRWLSAIAQKRFADALRSARTIDVTSDAMRDRYQKTLGVNSIVFHPYVPSLPKLAPVTLDVNSLVVGHVGTLYTLNELRLFCQALQQYAQQKGLKARMVLIGLAEKFIKITEEFPQLISILPNLPESEAIVHLHQCNFLYAMYPFDRKSAIFRQTSLATKLTTCVQAQRPVFAHTPEDSSLATVVTRYNLGLNCNSMTVSGLTNAIEKMHRYQVDTNTFETVRTALYDKDNVSKLEKCLMQNIY